MNGHFTKMLIWLTVICVTVKTKIRTYFMNTFFYALCLQRINLISTNFNVKFESIFHYEGNVLIYVLTQTFYC